MQIKQSYAIKKKMQVINIKDRYILRKDKLSENYFTPYFISHA